MPLNSQIPLMTHGVDASGAISAGANQANQLMRFAEEKKQAPIRNRLLDLQVGNAEGVSRQQQGREAVLDAVPINASLQRKDNAGALALIDQRIQKLTSQGRDPSDSIAFRERLINNPDQAALEIADIISMGQQTGILKAPQNQGFTLGQGQQRYDAAGNLIASGAPKSSGTGLAVDDFIGTPVRVERDGKTFLAGMVQTPDGGFEVREVGVNGELTDTSGRTAGEQVKDKGRTEAVKRAVVQSDKAFEKLESINTNIANLEEGINLVQNEGASTGVIADLLPTVRSSSIKLKNLQSRLGLDIIGAVTFGALSKGELDLALSTALPGKLPENELIQFLTEKRNAQVKLRDQITEFAQFTGAGDKTTAEWLEFKKQQKNTAQPSGAVTNLPTGVTEEDVAFTMERHNMTREQVLQQLGAQ